MQPGIVEQGLELMLYGMGTVLVFLSLLVVATAAMSRLVERLFPEPDVAPARSPLPPPPAAEDPNLPAVIAAAIHRYRARR